jgi:hypothetical protein
MSRGRSLGVAGILLLATILLLIASLGIWANRQLLDNDNWRASSAKLLESPEFRDALATTLVDQLYERVDVSGGLEQQLPPSAQRLAPVIASALQTASIRATEAFLATPRAQQLWIEVSGRAHHQLVQALEGKNVRNVQTQNGEIVLDVRPILTRLTDRLGLTERVKENAPPNAGLIVLVKSKDLKNAQHAIRAVRVLSVVFALIALVLFGVALYLARGSRIRVLAAVGGCWVVVGLLLAIARRGAGNWITGSLVKTDANRPAVRVLWSVETGLLRDLALVLIVYGIGIIIAAWLGSGTRRAVELRHRLAPTFREHVIAVYGVAAVLFLAFLAWGPSAGSRRALGVVILAALIALGIAMWRRQMLVEEAAP